ncbi:unnamed protein product, partial [Gordionus sp. m RMFG-2023]
MGDYKKYLDDLVATKHITGGAIVCKTGATHAATTGFAVTADEVKHMNEGFDKTDVLTSKGVMIQGKKYMFLGKNPDGNGIRTKLDKGGAMIVRTGKCIIIGLYDEKIGAGNCTKDLESLGDKMKKAG